jgi:hypothetical protein
MKSMQEVGAYRQAVVPRAKMPGKAGHAPAVTMELRVLRLAAEAADIRREFTPQQLAKYGPLIATLDACEALFDALGWGGVQAQPQRVETSGH